jgi:hypothetical protein
MGHRKTMPHPQIVSRMVWVCSPFTDTTSGSKILHRAPLPSADWTTSKNHRPDMRRMPDIAKIEFANGKTYFTILQVSHYRNSCSPADILLRRSKFCYSYVTYCPPSTNHSFDLFAHSPKSLYAFRSKCKWKPT